MTLINQRAREIHVKIVYCGPGLGGKTTNVTMLHRRLPADRRGRLVSIATDQDRTLFFDFMPLDLGPVNGFTTRFHLYTVPGQPYYRRARRAVLQGVDGIVFVADSAPERERDNLDSLEDLNVLLGTLGFSAGQLARLPRVVQYNKRDLPGATAIDHMRRALNTQGHPELEAVAVEGRGVSETLRIACKAVLARIGGASDAPGSSPAPRTAPPAAVSVVAPPRKRTPARATRR